MTKMRDFVLIALLVLVTTSCAGRATPTPALAPISVSDIFEISWRWAEFVQTDPPEQSVVPDPEGYTLLFMPGGALFVKADCNAGTGKYHLEGHRLALELEAITSTTCAPQSLSGQFLELLGRVDTATMDRGHLVLYLEKEAGRMNFDYGGPAGVPEAEPTPAGGAAIDWQKITLEPMGLPYAWQPDLVPATPYDESQPPGPTGLPEHIQIQAVPGNALIYIIPVEDYRQQWESAGNPAVSMALEHLQAILAEQPSPVPPFGMPVLPFEEVNGVNDLAVQGEYLDLAAASGVRFVGRFAQDASPVTNNGLRAIFQGFSQDGKHLIAFFYPVSTTALPNPEEVSAEEQERVMSDYEGYLRETVDMLNALGEEQWDPNLSTLDALLSSLSLNVTGGEQ
jgi:heat shock protein HslJ